MGNPCWIPSNTMWFGKRTQGGMKSLAALNFMSSQRKRFVDVSPFAALLAGPTSTHSLEKLEDLSVGGMPLCLLWHFASPPRYQAGCCLPAVSDLSAGKKFVLPVVPGNRLCPSGG